MVIDGTLEHIIYESDTYMVAKFQPNKGDKITITGNIISHPGESLQLTGKWTKSKYGNQFAVEKYNITLPVTTIAIEKYLSSGLIKGIGPVIAKQIVRVFKDKTLDIIESEPEKLSIVPKLGKRRIESIKKSWEEQKEIRNVMMFLQTHDISSTLATKIFQKYGVHSIAKVKENPYQLASDIEGVGFLTADKIGQKLGFETKSITRIKEGIIYFLNKYSNSGHIFCPQSEFYPEAEKLLGVDEFILEEALNELDKSGRVVLDKNAIYLKPFYVAENNVANKLIKINSTPGVTVDNINPSEINYTEQQKLAIKTALMNKISVITGGPGTGKTTIIKAIVNIAKKHRIKLAAPTGRAAKRLQEVSGIEAKTIHRLLEFTPNGFTFNQHNPLLVDIIIIDEASMLDLTLANQLFRAVPDEAIVILVGDIDQLPSVGAGNVLKDIINSSRFPVISLNQIFRQSEGSLISLNAHKINSGIYPTIDNKSTDFFFLTRETPEEVTATIKDLCSGRIQKKFNHGIKDIQILSPTLKGIAGVININTEIQKLNKSTVSLTRGDRTFKLNDKVMQTKNNYLKDVYNGDIGYITKIDNEEQQITVQYDFPVTYEYSELDQITLSYACSIHKSQGAEYPVVVIPVLSQHYIMLQRNLIYTGVTRGKEVVILVGTRKALTIAVKNNKSQYRNTKLAERLLSCSLSTR